MIIQCPSCRTRFFMSAPALGDGRQLRCSKCAHEWYQTPEALEEDDLPLSVMPRDDADYGDEPKSFDVMAFINQFRSDQPMPFAAVCAGGPFVILGLIILILFGTGGGHHMAVLPTGVVVEELKITYQSEGDAVLSATVINETAASVPAPMFLVRATHDGETQDRQAMSDDYTVIPAYSEVQLTSYLEAFNPEGKTILILLAGLREDVTESTAQGMSVDMSEELAPQNEHQETPTEPTHHLDAPHMTQDTDTNHTKEHH